MLSAELQAIHAYLCQVVRGDGAIVLGAGAAQALIVSLDMCAQSARTMELLAVPPAARQVITQADGNVVPFKRGAA